MLFFPGTARFVATGKYWSFIQFGRLWTAVRANPRAYWGALSVGLLAYVLGSVPVLGSVWAQLAMGHALGQLAHLTPLERSVPLPGL